MCESSRIGKSWPNIIYTRSPVSSKGQMFYFRRDPVSKIKYRTELFRKRITWIIQSWFKDMGMVNVCVIQTML